MPFRALLFLSLVLSAAIAVAQLSPYPNIDNTLGASGFRSELFGTVRDMENHVVSGARVELRDVSSGKILGTTFTLPTGGDQFNDVPVGQYELIAYSGLNEARTRVDFPGTGEINLRIESNGSQADRRAGGKNTVSVAQMKVPGNARKFFQKAIDAFRAARLNDAFNFVQKALGLYPDYAQALALRGVMNMQRGDNDKAEPDLQKAVELDYSDATGVAALASLYNNKRQFDDALLILNRGLSVHPDSWLGLAEMARAQIGKASYDEALKTIVKGEQFAPPTIAYFHLFRAQALAGLGNTPGAINEIKTYLAKDPNGQNADVARKMLSKLEAPGTPEAKK